LDQAPQEKLGCVLRSKWTLEQVLGSGGMATVYRASHRNGARVAIKILHREIAEDEQLRARFLREGYIANRVEHEGVVKVLDDDVDEATGLAFIVMELLVGENVEQRRRRKGGRLAPHEVLSIGYHLADVLSAAHETGVVHRDIKPENVFLTATGVLKVLDFGIARLREISGATASTLHGTWLGTPAYMAPEQARGLSEEVGPWSDIYGLGATLFELASGEPVHVGRTTAEQLIAAAMQPARSLGEAAPDAPEDLIFAVDKALAFEPGARFATMADVRTALQEATLAARHTPPRPSFYDFNVNRDELEATERLSKQLLEQRGLETTELEAMELETMDAVVPTPPEGSPGVTESLLIYSPASSSARRAPQSQVAHVNLLGQAADEILKSGGAVAAEAILSSHLRRLLATTKDRGLPINLLEWATRYALELALGTRRGLWFDYVIELHSSARQAVSLNTVEELFLALRSVDAVSHKLLDKYYMWLRSARGHDSASQVLLERVAALARLAGLKTSDV
jgi:serine/threonine protein kinase